MFQVNDTVYVQFGADVVEGIVKSGPSFFLKRYKVEFAVELTPRHHDLQVVAVTKDRIHTEIPEGLYLADFQEVNEGDL